MSRNAATATAPVETPEASEAPAGRLRRWFGRAAQSGIDALPMHLPVRLGGADVAQTKAAPVRVLGFDQALVWVTFALLAWGLVMVYSASIAMADNPRFARAGNGPTFYLVRHALFIAIAFVTALLAFQIPMKTWCWCRTSGGWSTARGAGCRWGS
jgi:cell division protein FtsW